MIVETFRFNRQNAAFLAVIAVLSLALVLIAPFALLAFAAISVGLFLVVWLKAIVRNHRLFGPFSPVEGALALSAAALVAGGVLVAVYATVVIGPGGSMGLANAMLPFPASGDGRHPVGSSSRHYGDPATQERFKQQLGKAGIPFTVETRDGKEFVGWTQEHNALVEAIHEKVSEGPLPAGRSVRFGNPATQQEFAEWLGRKGIKSETVQAYGEDYLVWEEGPADRLGLMNEFMAEKAKRCKEKTALAPGEAKCS